MNKIKLYIDFDGVILDTINATYQMLLDSYGIDLINHYKEHKSKNEILIREFYYNLDWNILLKETPEINDAINNIKKIIATNLFDVEILTHVNSENEVHAKRAYLKERLPGINVITTPKTIDKCDMVDPVNAILIDDYMINLVLWYKKGGLPIKFSDSGKTNEFPTITSLEQVIDMYDSMKKNIVNNKKKTKRKKEGK